MLLIMFAVFIVLAISYEVIPNDDVKLYVIATLFVIAVVTILLIQSCLTSAEKKLTPSVFKDQGDLQDPEEFNVTLSTGKGPINPFTAYAKLPQMSYLHTKDHISSLNEAEREQIENEEERNVLLAHSKAAEIEGGHKFIMILKNNERGWKDDIKRKRDPYSVNNK